MKIIAIARTGTMQTNISESLAFIFTVIIIAKISIIGARNAILITIIKAFWVFVTSVVRRVTSDAVENLSTLAKEKL